MTHRKGTFKPASARSKKAALAVSEDEPGELDQRENHGALETLFRALREGRMKMTDTKSAACLEGRHESTDPDSCVWCSCSCHCLKPLNH